MCALSSRLLPGHRHPMPIAAIGAHPLLAAMLDLWSASHDGTRLPARLDPLEMPRRVLPYLMLLDVERDPHTLRIRLAGTRLCESFGREMRGLALDDLFEDDAAAAVRASARHLAGEARPHLGSQTYRRAGGAWHYTQLLLPLSADGEGVTGILKAIDPESFRYEPSQPGARGRF